MSTEELTYSFNLLGPTIELKTLKSLDAKFGKAKVAYRNIWLDTKKEGSFKLLCEVLHFHTSTPFHWVVIYPLLPPIDSSTTSSGVDQRSMTRLITVTSDSQLREVLTEHQKQPWTAFGGFTAFQTRFIPRALRVLRPLQGSERVERDWNPAYLDLISVEPNLAGASSREQETEQ